MHYWIIGWLFFSTISIFCVILTYCQTDAWNEAILLEHPIQWFIFTRLHTFILIRLHLLSPIDASPSVNSRVLILPNRTLYMRHNCGASEVSQCANMCQNIGYNADTKNISNEIKAHAITYPSKSNILIELASHNMRELTLTMRAHK